MTDRELELLAQIRFDWRHQDELRASLIPMAALSESLLNRGAIPEVRLSYFTDPACNPGGRGRSRENVFENNGTSGANILAHPNFLKFLEYFVYGPKLPESIISKFKEESSLSGHLDAEDVNDLIPAAKAVVRTNLLNANDAADEFYKLVLECGGLPSSAESIRNSVRKVKVTNI